MAYISTSAHGQSLEVSRGIYKYGAPDPFIRIISDRVTIHLTPAEAEQLATDLQNALAEPQQVAA